MHRHRYLLLLGSLLLHAAVLLLLTHILLRGELARHEHKDTGPDFVATMKVPVKPVEVPAPVAPGRAANLAMPNVALQQPLPPTAIITSVTGPSFVVPGITTSTTDMMAEALNRVTASEHRGNGPNSGEDINIGGVMVNSGENLGVVLDVSGSMLTILPPIRKEIADHFANCPVFEAQNSLGRYLRSDDAKKGGEAAPVDPDLYQGCYALLDKGVSAIYIFTDFEDGEDKKATEDLVADLQKANVKLYICYTEGPPYQGLIDYSKASGGDCKKFVPDKERTAEP